MSSPLRFAIAGGGTGGHIEPALNLADELRRRDADTAIVVIGTPKGLEGRLVPQRGYDLRMIEPVPLPRRPGAQMWQVPSRLRVSVRGAQQILRDCDADVLVGFGGYVSIPAYLAAKRNKVPFVVHEANAKPGLANRVGARLTRHVVENYAGTLPHAIRLGCPLRQSITTLDRAAVRTQAREFFGLDPERPVLLVFGGSQGAASLNAAVSGARSELTEAGVQILHAVGPDKEDVHSQPGYFPVPFIDRMDLAYAAADLAVCRAGAMTCAEVAAVGLPCVYVPYPIGNGEQRFNAEPVVSARGGVLIDDAGLTATALVGTAGALLRDPNRLAHMSDRAAAYGIRDGAARLADVAIRAAGGVV